MLHEQPGTFFLSFFLCIVHGFLLGACFCCFMLCFSCVLMFFVHCCCLGFCCCFVLMFCCCLVFFVFALLCFDAVLFLFCVSVLLCVEYFISFFVVFFYFFFLQEQSRTGTHQPEQEQEHIHQSTLFGLRKYREYIWLDLISSHS